MLELFRRLPQSYRGAHSGKWVGPPHAQKLRFLRVGPVPASPPLPYAPLHGLPVAGDGKG